MSTQSYIEALENSQPIFDKDHLSVVLDNPDTLILIDFYELFLEQVVQLRKDIINYSKPYDCQLIEQTAHKFKSSSRSVGAFLMADIMNTIEETAKDGFEETLDEQLLQLTEICGITELSIRKEIADHKSLVRSNSQN